MTIPASLIARIRVTACQQGAFRLPTGQVLEEYFDEYLLAADPALLRDVAAEMARYVPLGTEVLAGMELGGIPLAVALSGATAVPAGFLRRERKSSGTCQQVEGCPVAGRDVVLVDDAVRSGSQMLRAVSVLRRAGASVASAICVLDRDIGGRARQLRIFQPVIEGMAELSQRGVGLGIITAQARRRLPFLLPPVVADLVDVVVAHEDAAPKPAPDGVFSALDRLGVSAARAMFIGDTANDMASGRSAGVLTVGAGWGFVGPGMLFLAGADVVLTEPDQVGIGLLAHFDGQRAAEFVTG